jgi:hypothetical protein
MSILPVLEAIFLVINTTCCILNYQHKNYKMAIISGCAATFMFCCLMGHIISK